MTIKKLIKNKQYSDVGAELIRLFREDGDKGVIDEVKQLTQEEKEILCGIVLALFGKFVR